MDLANTLMTFWVVVLVAVSAFGLKDSLLTLASSVLLIVHLALVGMGVV